MTDWHQVWLESATRSYGLPVRSGGHQWDEDTYGRYCKTCKRRWAEVVSATEADVEKQHFAYTGVLIENEQREFVVERDWLWSTIVDAASSGR